ncbi:MAG: hypothetical protein HYY76_05040 [Acidobacteria bacterium]|nr:hypothetical protein [Acidobacteriota bacterium]
MAGAAHLSGPAGGDAFAFFRPWIVVSQEDLERVDAREVVVRTLPGGNGQLAVLGLARVSAPPERLVAWTHAIADLKRGPFVLAIGRFSDPPVLEDLDGVYLDDRDLDAVRTCRSGDCALKLGEAEIASLRRAVGRAGAGWQAAVQREFRRILLARVELYQSLGLTALPPYADARDPVRPQEAFAAILASSPYLVQHLPDLAAQLESYPQVRSPGVESFFYWSKEVYNAAKPVVTVTHVHILRSADRAGAPLVTVAGKQIFASHYMNGALGLTVLMRGSADGAHYLVYLNRSQLDMVGGFFGFLKRPVLEGRIRRDTPGILHAVRSRLEGAAPPKSPPGSGKDSSHAAVE